MPSAALGQNTKKQHVKTYKTLLASSLALAFAASAHATSPAHPTLHIAGSTAYRAATITAIQALLKGTTGYAFSWVGSATSVVTGANEAIFQGTVSGTLIEIKVSFEGSVGGVADIVNGLTVGTGGTAYPNGGGGWLSDTYLTTNNGTPITGTPTFDTAVAPDATLSDAFQASTPFTKTTLGGQIVGIVPFVWVKSSAAALAALTNISASTSTTTGDDYHLLLGTYKFSGNPVFVVGRDEDSGTRLQAFGVSSIGKDYGDLGTSTVSVPDQYQISTNTPWPGPVTVDGFTYTANGHSGYATGGQLATALNGTTTAYVGYLGLNDAKNVNSGNNNLTYGSVAYSLTNVNNGKYKFWGYEHFLHGTLTSTLTTVFTSLASQIEANASVSGVPLKTFNSGLNVHRAAPKGNGPGNGGGDGTALLSGGTAPNVP